VQLSVQLSVQTAVDTSELAAQERRGKLLILLIATDGMRRALTGSVWGERLPRSGCLATGRSTPDTHVDTDPATCWQSDFKLRDEADKTVSQIKRNISEGFGHPTHADFARFLEYSFSSIGELRGLYDDAYKKRYATGPQLQPARDLCFRLERGLPAMIPYLRRNDPPPWWNQ
jgi:four helix bundle protein